MKTSMTQLMCVALVAAAVGLMSGCKEEPPVGLYDDAAYNKTSKATPVLASVSPAGSGLAGVTRLTLSGQNFSTVLRENLVFFDATLAEVLQASSTQLQVIAPALISDSIKVRVSVVGADGISSPAIVYKLEEGVGDFGALGSGSEPYAITCDASGNVYVALVTNSLGGGIKRILADGTAETKLYADPTAGVLKWTGLKFGSGGVLYVSGMAGLNGALYQIPAGGGAATAFTGLGRVQVYDFDIDPNGNFWVGGSMANIIRVKPDKTLKSFPFTATLRSLRVFGSYLYVGGKVDTVEGVWRFPLANDSLGAVEKYYDLTANYYGAKVNGITFALDGDMFIATSSIAGSVLVVHPDRSAEKYYPGLLSQENVFITYNNDRHLFLSRTGPAADGSDKKVVRVNTQKQGAPYYGRP